MRPAPRRLPRVNVPSVGNGVTIRGVSAMTVVVAKGHANGARGKGMGSAHRRGTAAPHVTDGMMPGSGNAPHDRKCRRRGRPEL